MTNNPTTSTIETAPMHSIDDAILRGSVVAIRAILAAAIAEISARSGEIAVQRICRRAEAGIADTLAGMGESQDAYYTGIAETGASRFLADVVAAAKEM